MQSNPTLDANLACISKYNPELVQKILKIESLKNNISVVENANGEPNLSYNGVILHNEAGSEAEAINIFNNVKNSPIMMHVVFGFGLGYLFQQFATNSQGIVLLYEPNIEILAATLEIADFSAELSKKNVFIFSDYNKFLSLYQSKYIMSAETVISFLPSYKRIFANEINDFAKKLYWEMGLLIMDQNYIRVQLPAAIDSILDNVPNLVKEPPFEVLHNVYKDKAALIVSAGPSLDKDIEVIKKYRNNFIIISVGQAARTLCQNGITPDFVALVELWNSSTQLEELDLSNTCLILEPLSNFELHSFSAKQIFSYPSGTNFVNDIWAEWADIDSSKYVSLGTVSYMAMYAAVILGCKDIILAGQDFAYIAGKCYTSGCKQNVISYSVDEKSGEILIHADVEKLKDVFMPKNANWSEEKRTLYAESRLDSIRKNLTVIEGIQGDKLPTTVDYASFALQFEKFAKIYGSKLNLYNTSLVGAKINGFRDKPLEEIVKYKSTVNKIDLKTDYAYDIPKIIGNLSNELDLIGEIKKILELKNIISNNFTNEFNKGSVVNQNCINYFRQYLNIYLDFKSKYCADSCLINCMQKFAELNYEAEFRKVSVNSDNNYILGMFNALNKYFDEVEKNLSQIENKIVKNREILNEMLNTKS